MNLAYVIPRLVRHFLPESMTRFLLLHSIVIHAGLETSEPAAAVNRYLQVLQSRGLSITGKRVMVFGYGGRFDVGLGLLQAGAAHVVLCEKYAQPDDVHNSALLAEFPGYLQLDDGSPRPRPESMTLLQTDIRDVEPSPNMPPFDFVFSSSVYEHLDDVDGITCSLAALTQPGGSHVHYVDLRDHFFKYPFEMLTFSEKVWRGWLNPTSNHNRFRLRDYRRMFESYFREVAVEVLERDDASFQRVRERVRPEFRAGDLQEDSVTLIMLVASYPKRLQE